MQLCMVVVSLVRGNTAILCLIRGGTLAHCTGCGGALVNSHRNQFNALLSFVFVFVFVFCLLVSHLSGLVSSSWRQTPG